MNINPTIGMQHRDGRSCWSLYVTLRPGTDDTSYELQVRHYAPEDEFRFVVCDMGDEVELLTADGYRERRDAIVEHEGQGPCEIRGGCSNPDGAQYEVARLRVCRDHVVCAPDPDGTGATPLFHSDALNRADALLADKARVATTHELQVLAALRARWDAFALLFNPAVTL